MKCHLWKTVGEEQYFGSAEQLEELNRRAGGIFQINGNSATKMVFNESEMEMNAMPAMPNTQPKLVTQKTKLVTQKTKPEKRVVNVKVLRDGKDDVIQVRELEAESPMLMPTTLTMIKTAESDQDVMEKLLVPQKDEEEETPLTIPSVVGKK